MDCSSEKVKGEDNVDLQVLQNMYQKVEPFKCTMCKSLDFWAMIQLYNYIDTEK